MSSHICLEDGIVDFMYILRRVLCLVPQLITLHTLSIQSNQGLQVHFPEWNMFDPGLGPFKHTFGVKNRHMKLDGKICTSLFENVSRYAEIDAAYEPVPRSVNSTT